MALAPVTVVAATSAGAAGDASVAAIVDAEEPSSTTLPDGVTWTDVRGYIDANFTGSRVFADAVYDAIHDSGQRYRGLTVSGDEADSAADVIAYFGVDDPDRTTITVTEPLEDKAVLTGVTLLANVGTLKIRDVGGHTGLAFLEDAFTSAASGKEPYATPPGPSVDIAPMNLITLPKRPYEYNLTRSRSSQHKFRTTAYSDLSVNVVRDPQGGDASIAIDTRLTGRGASVDFGADDESSGGAAIHPTAVTPTFGAWASEFGRDPTDRVTADGNVVTMSIPSCGVDGDYRERVAFTNLYKHYGNTVKQHMSIDYFYRTNVTYLNAVRITGGTTVLGDLKARKIDASTGEPLGAAQFKLYTDKAGTTPARQAVVGENGEVRRDGDGTIATRDVGTIVAEEDGTVLVRYLEPGDYYLKEITPPSGYGPADPNPVKVTVRGADGPIAGPTVSGGQGSEATVLAKSATARADNFKGASNWHMATNNITLTSKPDTARVDDGVYIRNGGKPIDITDFDAAGLTPLVDGGYTVTFGADGAASGEGADDVPEVESDVSDADTSGDDASAGPSDGGHADAKRYATAAEARDAINTMIKNKQLTCANAVIGIDAGERVYHRAATDDDVVTIADPPLPVHLRASAAKTLVGGGRIENDRFRFTLDGADGRGKVHETVGVKATPGLDAAGTADFSPLVFNKAGSYEFTVTEEIDESDTSVSYNPEGVSYRLWIDVEPNRLGKFNPDGSRADADGSDSDDGNPDDALAPRSLGLAAVVHAAKVTTGRNGEPIVGEREFIGTFDAASTNVPIMGEGGIITGYTPNPRPINTLMRFAFTNIAKDTTLPRTGAAGLLGVSTAGLVLLIVGVLIASRESRRHAHR